MLMNKVPPFRQESCPDISPVLLFPKFIIRFLASFNNNNNNNNNNNKNTNTKTNDSNY